LAVGTRLGGVLRRPPNERTLANKTKAISFAGYRGGVDLFPGSRATVFDPLMTQLGFDPSDTSTDVTTPSGIGNVASGAVLPLGHATGGLRLPAVRLAGPGPARHQREPHRRGQDDRRVLGGRPSV